MYLRNIFLELCLTRNKEGHAKEFGSSVGSVLSKHGGFLVGVLGG